MIHHTNFDDIAFVYDYLKKIIFGKTLDKAQIALIPYIPEQAKVLIVGGGTGQILVDIIKRKTVEHITFVELSNKMLDKAKSKVKEYNIDNLCFIKGTVDTLRGNPTFDVIITPFVLDLYKEHELLELMLPLDELLKPKGKWLCCDFEITTKSSWTKLWQRGLVTLMYSFFALTSQLKTKQLPDYKLVFRKFGYKSVASHNFYAGLIHSWVFIKTS